VEDAHAQANQVYSQVMENANGNVAQREVNKQIEGVTQAVNDEAQKVASELFSELFEDEAECAWLLSKLVKGIQMCVPSCMNKLFAKIYESIDGSPYSALLHFVLVELLGIYGFWYLQYNTASKLLNGMKKDIDKGKLNPKITEMAASSFKELGVCVAKTSSDELWLQESMDHHCACFGMNVDELDLQEGGVLDCPQEYRSPYIAMGMINVGCMIMCALVLLCCLYKYGRLLGLSKRRNHRDGEYLQFCYQLPRTRLYRYAVGLLVCLTWACVGFFVGMLTLEGYAQWLAQNILVDLLTLGVVAYHLWAPKAPKFQYNTESFATLQFKRPSFWLSGLAFSDKLTAGLLRAKGSVVKREENGENTTSGPADKGDVSLLACLLEGGEKDVTRAVAALEDYNPPPCDLDRFMQVLRRGDKAFREKLEHLNAKLPVNVKNLEDGSAFVGAMIAEK
jgi:hypothetical protein